MVKKIEFFLLPEDEQNEQVKISLASQRTGIPEQEITAVKILHRSIDARQNPVKISLTADVYSGETPQDFIFSKASYPDVSEKERVLIIGSGPAGLFAALKLIQRGLKPIIIERGKDVQSRRHDLADINKKNLVNPDSNYCFGEGGAGTYSDGKLYTRSTKRGDVKSILKTLVEHGAKENILIDAHPHIGTNKLPKIIQEIRNTILQAGGEIHFNTRLSGFTFSNKAISGCRTESAGAGGISALFESRAVVLATGHSARDIFYLLHETGIAIEPKPFALGLRIEHPQNIIDSIQYHCVTRNPLLPPASYALASQENGRGVYSFCMCPGGFIVPSATASGEVVVNGMSPSRRDSEFANSGIVVSVEYEDVSPYHDKKEFAFLEFQKSIEQLACQSAGGTQAAPAQRMSDFIQGKLSTDLPRTSYQPGITSVELTEILPEFIASRIKSGLTEFGKKMKGYLTNDAVLVGVESRTSSPIRIPRDKFSLMHPLTEGLFPCGEGAGYAGGIVSAAIDGENCAEKCAEYVSRQKK